MFLLYIMFFLSLSDMCTIYEILYLKISRLMKLLSLYNLFQDNFDRNCLKNQVLFVSNQKPKFLP